MFTFANAVVGIALIAGVASARPGDHARKTLSKRALTGAQISCIATCEARRPGCAPLFSFPGQTDDGVATAGCNKSVDDCDTACRNAPPPANGYTGYTAPSGLSPTAKCYFDCEYQETSCQVSFTPMGATQQEKDAQQAQINQECASAANSCNNNCEAGAQTTVNPAGGPAQQPTYDTTSSTSQQQYTQTLPVGGSSTSVPGGAGSTTSAPGGSGTTTTGSTSNGGPLFTQTTGTSSSSSPSMSMGTTYTTTTTSSNGDLFTQTTSSPSMSMGTTYTTTTTSNGDLFTQQTSSSSMSMGTTYTTTTTSDGPLFTETSSMSMGTTYTTTTTTSESMSVPTNAPSSTTSSEVPIFTSMQPSFEEDFVEPQNNALLMSDPEMFGDAGDAKMIKRNSARGLCSSKCRSQAEACDVKMKRDFGHADNVVRDYMSCQRLAKRCYQNCGAVA